MISVNELSVYFGGNTLFDTVSFLVNETDRIGLTGKNGAGKSTLLKIMASLQKPSAGTISIQKDCTIGYLPQELKYNSGKTVFEETATAFVEAENLEKKITHINEQLSVRTDYESEEYLNLISRLHELNDRFHFIGGHVMDAEIEVVLLGLGFERKDFSRSTDEFSGGWRMRIELAKILLLKPDVFLLDEPTNHLDIESIQWLENFLKTYPGAVVLISHDRTFLDNITKRTIEISRGKIYDYKANYSKYIELRKERKEQQAAELKNQEKYIEHTQQLIDKFRAKASKASMAQSLIKKLDRIEKIEVDEEDTSSIRFRFPPAPASGKVVLEALRLKKSYNTKTVFHDVDFIVERKERIAFVGRNGEGKSTLSKIIAGVLEHEGTLKTGYNVSSGYFAQNEAEMLDEEKTVFQTIDDIAKGDIRKNIRSLLGSFLFSGDDADKKVKVLSGGEKSRLAMCRLLLQPYNLLILDEPTNHLDIRSKDMLKKALLNFDGTLLIVSHDRDFLQGLTNKVFEFRNGTVKQHIGDVNEYLNARKITSLKELETKQNGSPAIAQSPKKIDFEIKKQREKEERILQNQIQKAEKTIEKLEAEIKSFDEKLLNPSEYLSVINDKTSFTKYEELKKQLDEEIKKWMKLQENIVET